MIAMIRQRGWSRVALVAIFAALVGFQLWASLHYVYSQDEIEHLHVSWLILNGKAPFLDFFEHHPPLYNYLLIPIVAACDTIRELFVASRLVSFAIWAATMVAAWKFLRLASSRFAAASVLMLVAVDYRWAMSFVELRPDTLMMLLMILSLLMLVTGFGHGARWRIVISGALYALSAVILPKAIAIAPALLIWFLVDAYLSDDRMRRAGCFALWALCAAIVGGGLLAFFLWRYPDFWFWNVTFNGALSEMYGGERGLGALVLAAWMFIRSNPLLVPLAGAGMVLTFSRFKKMRIGLLATIICLIYLVVLSQFMFSFKQYFVPLVFFSAVLAALAVDWFRSLVSLRIIAGVLVVGLVLAGSYSIGRMRLRPAADRHVEVLQGMLDSSESEDRFLACPPIHPILRGDATYLWYNYSKFVPAFEKFSDHHVPDWREEVRKSPPDIVVPVNRLYDDQCYSMDEFPRDLAPRYEVRQGDVPFLLLKREDPEGDE